MGVVLSGMGRQTSGHAEPSKWLRCACKSWPGSLPQNLLNYRILMLEVSLRPPPSTRRQESLPPFVGEGNRDPETRGNLPTGTQQVEWSSPWHLLL